MKRGRRPEWAVLPPTRSNSLSCSILKSATGCPVEVRPRGDEGEGAPDSARRRQRVKTLTCAHSLRRGGTSAAKLFAPSRVAVEYYALAGFDTEPPHFIN